MAIPALLLIVAALSAALLITYASDDSGGSGPPEVCAEFIESAEEMRLTTIEAFTAIERLLDTGLTSESALREIERLTRKIEPVMDDYFDQRDACKTLTT